MSRSHRTLDNGDLVFPRRGPPPAEVPGYERDPRDPYVFKAAFIPCRYRTNALTVLPCGKLSCSWFCQLKGITVSVPSCDACDVDPK